MLESREAQRMAMRAGLRRLFVLQLSAEIKQLSRSLPNFETMSLHYSTIGTADQLREDLVQTIADRALFEEGDPEVRTQEEYARRAGDGWKRLSRAMIEVVESVGAALSMYADLHPRLQRTVPPAMADSINDLTEQMRWLFVPHFVIRTPAAWLKHLPRFAKAMDVRLRKLLDAGLSRDMAGLHQIRPLWKQYVQRATSDAENGRHDPELELYRWMIEELRVSAFAQELKTSIPISPKRALMQWEKTAK